MAEITGSVARASYSSSVLTRSIYKVNPSSYILSFSYIYQSFYARTNMFMVKTQDHMAWLELIVGLDPILEVRTLQAWGSGRANPSAWYYMMGCPFVFSSSTIMLMPNGDRKMIVQMKWTGKEMRKACSNLEIFDWIWPPTDSTTSSVHYTISRKVFKASSWGPKSWRGVITSWQ